MYMGSNTIHMNSGITKIMGGIRHLTSKSHGIKY